MDQRVCESTHFTPHLSSCPPRKVTTLHHRGSSEWIKLVPPPYSTALCTKCLTTALEKCRYVIKPSFCSVLLANWLMSQIAETAGLLQQALQMIRFRFKQPHLSIFYSVGLQDTTRFWPNSQCWDRQQGHKVEALGGSLHIRALAGQDL